jgi:hypothetical protein
VPVKLAPGPGRGGTRTVLGREDQLQLVFDRLGQLGTEDPDRAVQNVTGGPRTAAQAGPVKTVGSDDDGRSDAGTAAHVAPPAQPLASSHQPTPTAGSPLVPGLVLNAITGRSIRPPPSER